LCCVVPCVVFHLLCSRYVVTALSLGAARPKTERFHPSSCSEASNCPPDDEAWRRGGGHRPLPSPNPSLPKYTPARSFPGHILSASPSRLLLLFFPLLQQQLCSIVVVLAVRWQDRVLSLALYLWLLAIFSQSFSNIVPPHPLGIPACIHSAVFSRPFVNTARYYVSTPRNTKAQKYTRTSRNKCILYDFPRRPAERRLIPCSSSR
ncbi:hypothetical protein LY78DRAFT_638602, partial [Colletotrichum sublineola]